MYKSTIVIFSFFARHQAKYNLKDIILKIYEVEFLIFTNNSYTIDFW